MDDNCEITEKMRKTSEDNQFVEILANQMSKETHFTSESKKLSVNNKPILNTPVSCIKPLKIGDKISIN